MKHFGTGRPRLYYNDKSDNLAGLNGKISLVSCLKGTIFGQRGHDLFTNKHELECWLGVALVLTFSVLSYHQLGCFLGFKTERVANSYVEQCMAILICEKL
jgi:hypothetical protein